MDCDIKYTVIVVRVTLSLSHGYIHYDNSSLFSLTFNNDKCIH